MHEVVGYTLLIIIALSIVGACVVVTSTHMSATMRGILLLEAQRIANYVAREILLAYTSAAPNSTTVVYLDLPDSIRGRIYTITLDNDTKEVIVTIMGEDVVVKRNLASFVPAGVFMSGYLESIWLSRKVAVLRVNSSAILLEVE